MNEKKVIAQYEAVRRLGQTNMLDKHLVQHIALENGFHELVVAAEDDYTKILSNYSEWMKLVNEDDIPKARPVEATWRLKAEASE